MKRMTVSLAEQIDRILEMDRKERESAARAIRIGKMKGSISPNGDVQLIVDGISSVTYREGRGVTYSW